MGAWGHGNFDSDQAWDFADEFIENPSEESLLDALTTVLEQGKENAYIEVDEANAALVAAEIIAATIHKAATDFPDELRESTAKFQTGTDPEILHLARKAVRKYFRNLNCKSFGLKTGNLTSGRKFNRIYWHAYNKSTTQPATNYRPNPLYLHQLRRK